jgi:uncharacterized protein YlxW (UPF0749 family)
MKWRAVKMTETKFLDEVLQEKLVVLEKDIQENLEEFEEKLEGLDEDVKNIQEKLEELEEKLDETKPAWINRYFVAGCLALAAGAIAVTGHDGWGFFLLFVFLAFVL